jgi:hydrogenase-4 component F
MQQIVSHSVTKSYCFFAAGSVLLTANTREIAAVRGLIRRSPAASAALIFGALAIAGAPPLAVFLSEFSILKAGLGEGHYIATGLLALFIVIAFFGMMWHVNRMVFDIPPDALPLSSNSGAEKTETFRLPFSCRLILILGALPVLVFGFYIPKPLHDLLQMAASSLVK